MEKQDYIQLFDKFLLKQASPEEVQILIQWLTTKITGTDKEENQLGNTTGTAEKE